MHSLRYISAPELKAVPPQPGLKNRSSLPRHRLPRAVMPADEQPQTHTLPRNYKEVQHQILINSILLDELCTGIVFPWGLCRKFRELPLVENCFGFWVFVVLLGFFSISTRFLGYGGEKLQFSWQKLPRGLSRVIMLWQFWKSMNGKSFMQAQCITLPAAEIFYYTQCKVICLGDMVNLGH